jgi:PhnB protein
MTGMTSLRPRLVVSSADKAIEFYREAFGAEPGERYTVPSGAVVHAEITVFGQTVSLKDEDEHDRSPGTLGGPGVLMEVTTDDPDALGEAIERAGGSVIYPITDAEYGARGGRFADPFGHQWMLQTPVSLEPDEVQDRLDDAYG